MFYTPTYHHHHHHLQYNQQQMTGGAAAGSAPYAAYAPQQPSSYPAYNVGDTNNRYSSPYPTNDFYQLNNNNNNNNNGYQSPYPGDPYYAYYYNQYYMNQQQPYQQQQQPPPSTPVPPGAYANNEYNYNYNRDQVAPSPSPAHYIADSYQPNYEMKERHQQHTPYHHHHHHHNHQHEHQPPQQQQQQKQSEPSAAKSSTNSKERKKKKSTFWLTKEFPDINWPRYNEDEANYKNYIYNSNYGYPGQDAAANNNTERYGSPSQANDQVYSNEDSSAKRVSGSSNSDHKNCETTSGKIEKEKEQVGHIKIKDKTGSSNSKEEKKHSKKHERESRKTPAGPSPPPKPNREVDPLKTPEYTGKLLKLPVDAVYGKSEESKEVTRLTENKNSLSTDFNSASSSNSVTPPPASRTETEIYAENIRNGRYSTQKEIINDTSSRRQLDTPSNQGFKLYKLYQNEDGIFSLLAIDITSDVKN